MSKDRRTSARKSIEGITANRIYSLQTMTEIATAGLLVDASTTGFLLLVDRKQISNPELRQGLSLTSLVGERILLNLSEMNLEIDGIICRTKHIGKGVFELAIDFSTDAPDYWRECLVELLPAPGEMAE